MNGFPVKKPTRTVALALILVSVLIARTGILLAEPPPQDPVVARVEMKLVDQEQVIDVIEQGDLLTVLEERDDDYVILTHNGSKGAVAKVNAVRIPESLDIYTDLIKRNPKEGRFYTLRASAHWSLGKSDEALKDFDRAIELGYDAAHAYSSRGLFFAAKGEYEKAIKDYDEAFKRDPDDVGPLVNRAAVRMAQGDFAKAIADYNAVLSKREDDIAILHQRAIAHKASGDLEKATDDFASILKLDPKDFRAAMGRGYIRFQQKRHDDAVQDFATAIELNPKDAVAWNNRGYNLAQLGKQKEALADYEKAIELAPEYALALQNIAWLLATAEDESLRDPPRAVKMAKAACELSNYQSVGDLSALAAALAADGKHDEAVGWQEKVVAAVDERYKMFARKTLQRYENGRGFVIDPIAAEKAEQASAEKAAVDDPTRRGE
ncbi:tetratricopeptide repeat protein [Stieleria varia]|nr:tetratricopeptide repeat protein [Stieleria varia]